MTFLNALDQRLFYAVYNLQELNLDLILAWPTCLGSLKVILPVLLVLSLLWNRAKFLYLTFASAVPVLLAHESAEWLKLLFKRPRPFSVFEGIKIIFGTPTNFSFPSGHASNAFAAALILSAYFGVPRWLSLGMAVLIGITRLYVGVHFPSDVLGGAFLGTLIALVWLLFFKPVPAQ